MSIFSGAGVALSTPFNEHGINFSAFEALIEYQLDNEIDCLVPLGTTGEPCTMTKEERSAVISFVVKQAGGRVPIIAGTGSNCTLDAVYAAKEAEDLGVDAILVVTPYYNKCTQDGLIWHFEAIANATRLPIVVYNVPSRTGVNVLPKTFLKLADIDNVVAVKEACACITQIAELAAICKGKLDIYSGNDDHIVPILSLGGIGVISVIANIVPKDTHDMVACYLNGDTKTAMDLQHKQFPLYRALFNEVNPIPVKAGLKMLGFDMGIPRLPLTEASDETKAMLEKALVDYGFDIG